VFLLGPPRSRAAYLPIDRPEILGPWLAPDLPRLTESLRDGFCESAVGSSVDKKQAAGHFDGRWHRGMRAVLCIEHGGVPLSFLGQQSFQSQQLTLQAQRCQRVWTASDSELYRDRIVGYLGNYIANPVYVMDASSDPLIRSRIGIDDSPRKGRIETANRIKVFHKRL